MVRWLVVGVCLGWVPLVFGVPEEAPASTNAASVMSRGFRVQIMAVDPSISRVLLGALAPAASAGLASPPEMLTAPGVAMVRGQGHVLQGGLEDAVRLLGGGSQVTTYALGLVHPEKVASWSILRRMTVRRSVFRKGDVARIEDLAFGLDMALKPLDVAAQGISLELRIEVSAPVLTGLRHERKVECLAVRAFCPEGSTLVVPGLAARIASVTGGDAKIWDNTTLPAWLCGAGTPDGKSPEILILVAPEL